MEEENDFHQSRFHFRNISVVRNSSRMGLRHGRTDVFIDRLLLLRLPRLFYDTSIINEFFPEIMYQSR